MEDEMKLNSILIEGVVNKRISIKETESGEKVCTFSIIYRAETKRTGVEEIDCCFDVEYRSYLADKCFKYADEGVQVRIVGMLMENRLEKDNGETESKIFILVEHIKFRDDLKLIWDSSALNKD
jgi:single-strand DNA-binding protein